MYRWRQLLLPTCGTTALIAAMTYQHLTDAQSSEQWITATLYALATCSLLAYCVLFTLKLRGQDRWERTGRCRACGYDRRTLEVTQPCPECGLSGIQ